MTLRTAGLASIAVALTVVACGASSLGDLTEVDAEASGISAEGMPLELVTSEASVGDTVTFGLRGWELQGPITISLAPFEEDNAKAEPEQDERAVVLGEVKPTVSLRVYEFTVAAEYTTRQDEQVTVAPGDAFYLVAFQVRQTGGGGGGSFTGPLTIE